MNQLWQFWHASLSDKLTRSDWTQLPDAPLTAERKQLWEDHRQALRDIPDQAGFPNNVVWSIAR